VSELFDANPNVPLKVVPISIISGTNTWNDTVEISSTSRPEIKSVAGRMMPCSGDMISIVLLARLPIF